MTARRTAAFGTEALRDEIARLRGLLERAGIDADGASDNPAYGSQEETREPGPRELRRLSEQVLRSEERFQFALAAGSVVGTWDWDIPGDRVVADADFARLYSVDPAAAARGAPIGAFMAGIHPNDRDRVAAAIAERMRQGGVFALEYRLVQRDGSILWIEARGRCYLDPNGTPSRFPGIVIDITDRKRMEARQNALIELGDRLRNLVDPAAIAFVSAEILGRELDVGRAGYGTIDAERETITIERDWTAPGVGSLAGTLHFRQYGSYIEDLKRGQPVVIADARLDERTRETASSLAAIAATAFVNLPLLEHGRFVALFYLNHGSPRAWSADEIAFIGEVTGRTRVTVERARAEEQQRLLMRELQHRVKNTLAMVQAIASQTFKGAVAPQMRDAFTARLVALAHANDVLTGAGWSAAPVRDIVTGATIPHCAGPERFTISGPAIAIAARAALALTLALHELCTNAAKYGALSNDDGHVVIDWEVIEDETFRLRWAERGGPRVAKPVRFGFGSRLIERSLGPQLGGEVKTEFEPDGIVCTFQVPLASVQQVDGSL